MRKLERVKAFFLYVVFLCYILLLIKILFLSRVSFAELFDRHRTAVRSVNLIPFCSISEFLSGSSRNLKDFAFANVVGNILIFFPLGVYSSVLSNHTRVRSHLLRIIAASVVVEIIQGLLAIGTADIDDVILNSLGGWIGIAVYKLLLLLLRNKKNVHTAVVLLSVIVGLPVIFYYLFMIKMRF
ncbi:VanZ family protein [Paenibacillus sacheonensis]|uniref:VanZ family protein n=1 Tax=Paenibacillus sacheonensis TaxID=742054 RepID=A0A7X5C4Y9_9BACL|nr:VanZ family protein [Paenibacillus sacheonensis]MBM7567230.1 glycopeptide antibiotics resistance protein [Paenibacillus sacheonensis]NBC72874.1 VanZ family protein [Paenibacillus sacheonensis]